MVRYHDRIMRNSALSFATCVLFGAFFLWGCDEDDDSGDSSNQENGDGDSGSSGDGDGDGDARGEGDTRGDGDGDGDGDDDPYCVSAWRGLAALDDFLSAMNPLSLNPDLDLATLHESGTQGAEAAEEAGAHLSRAQEFVVDSDVHTAFDQILTYQEVWMVPQAEIAESATSVEQYHEASSAHVLSPGVAEANSEGALASGTIALYTLTRCGSTEAR